MTTSSLTTAEELVHELYSYRDSYFVEHPSASPYQKVRDVEAKLKTTLEELEKDKEIYEAEDEGQFNFLKGKALNVLGFNSESLEILTRVVKFHPKNIDAWNELGECFWKKGDFRGAKNCFEGALRHSKNAASLRNLSMVLRQMHGTPEEKAENIRQSVERACDAVDLNMHDGKSWYVLGNAYFAWCFTVNQDLAVLQKGIDAYNNAIHDEKMSSSVELHSNRAMAFQYKEEFIHAMESYEKAAECDPSSQAPKEKVECVLRFLDDVQTMVEKKGLMKPRKIQDLLKSFDNRIYGPYLSKKVVKIADLQLGKNDGTVLAGKVVCSLSSSNLLAFTFCIIDESEECIAVSVYNLVSGKGVLIGDSIAIPDPEMKKFQGSYKGKDYQFRYIRVTDPQVLVVNAKKWGPRERSHMLLSLTFMSD